MILVLAAVAVLLFGRAMDRDLNHDEHQFLAPGALLAREGLQPYRDYPYFHLPNLVFLYAALDAVFHRPVLTAKLCSTVASTLVAILLAVVVFRGAGYDPRRLPAAALFSTGLLALLICDPLFLYTAGKTWNHEVPSLFAVLAVLLQIRGWERRSVPAFLGAGFCLALAIGCRLTFITLALPFAASFFWIAPTWKGRFQMAGWFTLGGFIGSLPSLYYLCTVPEAFLFGNLEFPRLRLLDPENTRIQKTAVWWRKIRYFFKEIAIIDRRSGRLEGSTPILLAFITAALLPAWHWLRRRQAGSGAAAFAAAVVFAALLGCFLPSRYQYQHFFAIVPLASLAIALGLREWIARGTPFWLRIVFAICVLAGIILGAGEYRAARIAFTPGEWYPTKTAEFGREIALAINSMTRPGAKVLTFAPAYPLEGGLRIYPEFATGPFAYKNGWLIPKERRARLRIVSQQELRELLTKDRPAAILLGYERGKNEDLEAALEAYAIEHGFRKVPLGSKRELWLHD